MLRLQHVLSTPATRICKAADSWISSHISSNSCNQINCVIAAGFVFCTASLIMLNICRRFNVLRDAQCCNRFLSRSPRAYVFAANYSGSGSDTTDGCEPSTHFGFETVSESEKEKKVYGVFHNVAESYDIMNDAMSVGVHRLWKDCFIQRMSPTPGTRLIDVAGGTGDIAFRFLDYVNNERRRSETDRWSRDMGVAEESSSEGVKSRVSHVTICDINDAMLDVGRRKAAQQGRHETGDELSWLLGNAEQLPVTDQSYDLYTVAFGIRNMTHIDVVLREAYRVLRPGGRFMCLEFSEVSNPLIRALYDSYSFQVLPALGHIIASDWRSYQYLVESIRQFPAQEEFKFLIEDAGFCNVSYENLTFGVAAIHSAFKL